MDRRQALLAGVVGVALVAASGDTAPTPTPTPGPTPNPADVQQLRAAFGDSEAGRFDCLRFGVLCAAVGDRLDADTRLPADKRRLSTAGKLNDFRRQVREDYLGAPLTGKYPLLTEFLTQFFTARVGEFDDKLDDSKRAAWSKAFADLGAAAQEAAR